MAAKDVAAEEELDLSLDLSLGGSIGTKKSRDKERLKLIKYPSENLQPSLRKFATESLLNESRGLSTSNHNSGNDLVSAAGAGAGGGRGGVGGGEWVSQKEEVQLQISSAAWPLKPHHHHHHHHRNPHSNYQEQAAEHSRILRTCSSGAVLAPSAALLHRQPSHDFLLAERKKEAPVQQHQHQQQQPLLQASELLEWHRKREAQALRRQEARRKREEKQNKKAKNKDLLDSQRSLHREKDRAAREIDLRTSLRKKDCKDSDMAAATMDDAVSAAVVADPCNGGSCCKKSGSPDCDDKTSECVASNDHGDGGSPNSFLLSGAATSASMAALGFSVPYMMQQQQTRNAAMVSGNALRNGFSSLPGWMQMASMPSPGQAAPISRTSSGRTAPALPDQESRSSEGTSSNESKGQSSKSPEQSSSRNLHHLSKVPSFTSLPSQMLAFSEARTNNTSSRREQPDCSRAADKISCSTAPSSTPQTAWEIKNEATCRTSSDIAGNSTEGQHSPCSNAFPKHSSFGDHPKPAANDSASSITRRDSGFKETGNSSATMPLHLVTTTGVGPNGITVTGILTSYSSSQVKIICVCHGTSMTPAEFVQHAGSTDISNPLRNIVVNPIGIPTTLARG